MGNFQYLVQVFLHYFDVTYRHKRARLVFLEMNRFYGNLLML